MNLKVFLTVGLLWVFAFSYATEKTIVIDIGHGGHDHGFEIEGLKEKDIAFEIGLAILGLQKDDSVNIILTRNSDEFISLDQRVKFINSLKPDLVVSLHINSHTYPHRSGMDFFVCSDSEFYAQSTALAQDLESSLGGVFKSNGIRETNFSILKNTETPIALIELGYLSHEGNRDLLISEAGRHKIAQAIYNIIK